MTLGELEGLYYLSQEIALYDSRLAALDRERKKIRIQGAARQEWNAGAEEYRRALIDNRERCKQERSALLKFIEGISDPFTRSIFKARFVENKSWWETADSVSNEAGSVKMIVYRYLRKYNEETGAA